MENDMNNEIYEVPESADGIVTENYIPVQKKKSTVLRGVLLFLAADFIYGVIRMAEYALLSFRGTSADEMYEMYQSGKPVLDIIISILGAVLMFAVGYFYKKSIKGVLEFFVCMKISGLVSGIVANLLGVVRDLIFEIGSAAYSMAGIVISAIGSIAYIAVVVLLFIGIERLEQKTLINRAQTMGYDENGTLITAFRKPLFTVADVAKVSVASAVASCIFIPVNLLIFRGIGEFDEMRYSIVSAFLAVASSAAVLAAMLGVSRLITKNLRSAVYICGCYAFAGHIAGIVCSAVYGVVILIVGSHTKEAVMANSFSPVLGQIIAVALSVVLAAKLSKKKDFTEE